MDTLMAAGDNEAPKPERTDAEKVAQYRVDYRESLKSVGQVLANKVSQE